MDRPIQAGDLVIILRGHCVDSSAGNIVTVLEIQDSGARFCQRCGIIDNPGVVARLRFPDKGDNDYFAPLAWLKRIDPLSEPEQIERKQEQPA